jgi:hypothetical protein
MEPVKVTVNLLVYFKSNYKRSEEFRKVVLDNLPGDVKFVDPAGDYSNMIWLIVKEDQRVLRMIDQMFQDARAEHQREQLDSPTD